MNLSLSLRRVAVGIALGGIAATGLLVAPAHGGRSAASRAPHGARVALRKTALGSILVDARGRTLYLFEKDRNRMSACDGTCAGFWPPLVSPAAPHAAKGVHRPLLALAKRRDGRRQVTYAGHLLYTFVGDQAAGQTSGEGSTEFGAEWYAVAANGRAVERGTPNRRVARS